MRPSRKVSTKPRSALSKRARRAALGEDRDLYLWYAEKAAQGRWSAQRLKAQIDLKLHERQAAGVSNAARALPAPEARRVLEATKDPYVFDFLELTDDAKERLL